MAKKKKEEIPYSIDVEFDGKIYPFRVYKDTVFDKEAGGPRAVVCAYGNGEMRDDLQMEVCIQSIFGCRTMEQLKHLCWCGLRNQRVDWERELARRELKIQNEQERPQSQALP